MPGSTIQVSKSNRNRCLMVTENMTGGPGPEETGDPRPCGCCPVTHTRGEGKHCRWVSRPLGGPRTMPRQAEHASPAAAWLSGPPAGVLRAPPSLNSPETRTTWHSQQRPRGKRPRALPGALGATPCWPGALQVPEKSWFSEDGGRCRRLLSGAHCGWSRLSSCPLHFPEVTNALDALCSYCPRPILLETGSSCDAPVFNDLTALINSLSKLQPCAFPYTCYYSLY